MKVRVTVMPKETVLDPQGRAVRDALHQLGLTAAGTVRVGKMIEIDLPGERDEATEAKLHEVCRDLLSNPVIEDYRLEI